MQISEILSNKHGPVPSEVVTCDESSTVNDALKLMTDHNIGAVVVMSGEQVAGVYSERDVVKNCHQRGNDFRDLPITELMTSNVIQVQLEQSADDALNLMRDNRIRHLPVIDQDKIVGFLSLRDLMNSQLDYANKKAKFLQDQLLNIDKPLPM